MSDGLSSSLIGLTSMSFVSTLASRFLRYFWQRSDICAILFQSDILAHIVFIPSGFELTSRQGIFLLIFHLFSRNDASGEQCKKKKRKKEKKKKEKKRQDFHSFAPLRIQNFIKNLQFFLRIFTEISENFANFLSNFNEISPKFRRNFTKISQNFLFPL